MANGKFAGGIGTVDNPYLIEDAYDLNAIRNNLTANYKLINDIDMNVAPYNTGAGWVPIGTDISSNIFNGILDGDFFNIKNLFINKNTEYCGLFSFINSTSILKNLRLINANIKGYHKTAILCGLNRGKIKNCYASGIINLYNYASGVGGLVANNNSGGTIENSCTNVNITASQYVGSIMGGFCGGNTYGIIKNCYSTGVLISDKALSGFLYSNINGTVQNCYSTCVVQATSYQGGLIVSNNDISITTNSYWDIEVSGVTVSPGGGTGKTTLEMKTQSTYVDWDKELTEDGKNVWLLHDGRYPKLWFEKLQIRCLVKSLDKYYSINKEFYDQVNKKFNEVDASNITEEFITSTGFILSDLCSIITIGDESFKPIEKFENPFEVKVYKQL